MVKNIIMCVVLTALFSMGYSILCIPEMSGSSVWWGSPGVWSHFPGPDDDVLIPTDVVLNVTGMIEINNLTVNGLLYGLDATMITNGDVTVGNTGTITVLYGGSWHSRIHGDLEVNGFFTTNTCIFYGDEDDDQSATITQGAGAVLWSEFWQDNYSFHLDMLSDLNLMHPGGYRSSFHNADIRMNGHSISNTNLTSTLLWGNTTDFNCRISDSIWLDIDLYNNISLGGDVQFHDSGTVVHGNLINTELFTGGWVSDVSIEINGDFTNNGNFHPNYGYSVVLYLAGNLTNNGQYYYVSTYFDGDGTESDPQVVTIGPLSTISADWNSFSSYVELIGDLNMLWGNWTIGNLKVQNNLIKNAYLYNGTISTQGYQGRMENCILTNITVNGDLQILEHIYLGDANIVINGNVTNSGTITCSESVNAAITITGNLTNLFGSGISPSIYMELIIYLAGNLFNYGWFNPSTIYFNGTTMQQITVDSISYPVLDSDIVIGNAGVALQSNVAIIWGKTITLGSNGLYLEGHELMLATLMNGNVYGGILRSCSVISCVLDNITSEDYFYLGDVNNSTVGVFTNNGTLLTPDVSPGWLTCHGPIVNNGMVTPAEYGILTIKCYDDITSNGTWYADTMLCGSGSRTIVATHLGTNVSVEPSADVVLTGVNHMPGFSVPDGSSLTVDTDGELVMNNNEYFTGNVINHGIFRNGRNTFTGSNEFYGLGITVDDIIPSIQQITVTNTATLAPGMDFAINQWWNLQTNFYRTPAPHNLILSYRDELLNGNTEAGLAVYYSADNGTTWQVIPEAGIVRDPLHNSITVLESELNGLFTLSSLFYNWVPSSLTIQKSGNGAGVSLSWSPTDGALRYRIYRSDAPYGSFTFITETPNTSWEDNIPPAKAFYRVIASTTLME